MSLVSHVERNSVWSVTCLVVFGCGSDKVDFLCAFLDVEVDEEVAGLATNADLVAGHVAVLPDGSSKQPIRPFFDDVLVGEGKVGLAGTIGFGQIKHAMPKCVRKGAVPDERIDGEFEMFGHGNILEREDDREFVCRCVRLVVAREDRTDFHDAGSVYGCNAGKAGQQAHEGPKNTEDEVHGKERRVEDSSRRLEGYGLGVF